MWKVFVIEGDKEVQVYRGCWMPTIDDMEVVSKVRGKKYKVVSPEGKDVTASFPYGTPT